MTSRQDGESPKRAVASLKGNGREGPVLWMAIHLPAGASLPGKGWAMHDQNCLLRSCEESGIDIWGKCHYRLLQDLAEASAGRINWSSHLPIRGDFWRRLSRER
jgi:hypothetical protein